MFRKLLISSIIVLATYINLYSQRNALFTDVKSIQIEMISTGICTPYDLTPKMYDSGFENEKHKIIIKDKSNISKCSNLIKKFKCVKQDKGHFSFDVRGKLVINYRNSTCKTLYFSNFNIKITSQYYEINKKFRDFIDQLFYKQCKWRPFD